MIVFESEYGEGVVTYMFDEEGNETDKPTETYRIIVKMLTGQYKDKFLVMNIEPDEFTEITYN